MGNVAQKLSGVKGSGIGVFCCLVPSKAKVTFGNVILELSKSLGVPIAF